MAAIVRFPRDKTEMQWIGRFVEVNILCIGDVMVDRFVLGSVERISPESPVPVFSVKDVDLYPGGAANVARNVAALGGHCTLVGVVGPDQPGATLVSDLQASQNIRAAFITCAGRPTTEKTRFVAQGQHMLRADLEASGPIPESAEEELLAVIAAEVPNHQIMVLSDYAKGVLSPRVTRGAIDIARAQGIPVLVDPKSRDLSRYDGATLITPNSKEILASTGIDPSTDDDAAVTAGRRGLELAAVDAILVTRAGKGMTLVPRASEPVTIRSCAREVYDVVGAGDTVIAALSLAMGAGAELADASRIANVAAGIVVARRGTSTVSRVELLEELARDGNVGLGGHGDKVLTFAEACALVKAWKNDGHRIGFTNGCFDVLHIGHVRLLEFARAHCDRLIVGLNSDSSTRGLKGPERPINSEVDRAEILAAIAAVDAVVIFDEPAPQRLIEYILPDLLVKGADYVVSEIVGADVVRANGGEVLRFELVPGKSSTSIIDRVKEGAVS